jgi:hypothetical protein
MNKTTQFVSHLREKSRLEHPMEDILFSFSSSCTGAKGVYQLNAIDFNSNHTAVGKSSSSQKQRSTE